MRRGVVVLIACVIALVPLAPVRASTKGGTVVRRTEAADAVSEARDYLLFTPSKLAPPNQRALVVFLHGCAQTANDAMDGVPWNRIAEARGLAVVYPEQSLTVDGNAAHCWNTGQAPLYPRGQHELETLARITRDVRDELRIPAGRVFITGISSGAMMSAAMAATYPDLYAAMGSVVGCGYPCGDASGVGAQNRMGEYARVVPGFFVAGTADYLVNPALSQAGVVGWARANGWSSTTPETTQRDATPGPTSTDLCLQEWNNPCTADAAGWQDYPTTVSRFRAADGNVVVESWLLHGLSHDYPGGDRTAGTFTDPHGPDITTAMLDFFLANAR